MSDALNILLVEDDHMIGQSLSRALKDAGMLVDWVQDGIKGQAAIESGDHDLVLLDLGLPNKSGMDILKDVRARRPRTNLFIITARDALDDLVTGLDLGADDYLIKPFGFKELVARIRGVLRRHDNRTDAILSNGEITMDLATHEATYGGTTLSLSNKEFTLLYALTEYPGVILSRAQIERRLYGCNEEVDSNVVEVLIHALRKKFGKEIIRNVRGIGWMVVKNSP